MRALAGIMLLAVSCSTDSSPFTPFPMRVDMSEGPVLVDLQIDQEQLVTASVDTMSPLTVLDSLRAGDVAPGQPVPVPKRTEVTLTLLSRESPEATPVPRIRYGGVSALELHPCITADRLEQQSRCQVGQTDETSETAPRQIDAILGADVLAKGAARFSFGDSHMSFFPDIAGDDAARTLMCEAVFPSPFRGGGTLVIGGAEVSFNGRRIAIGGCWIHRQDEQQTGTIAPAPGLEQGLDSLFVVSTGLGITLITASTYQQYRDQIDTSAPAIDALPPITVHLPSGPISAHLATMSDLALVGGIGSELGPCSERFANAYLHNQRSCTKANDDDPCPCTGDAGICRTSAVLELYGGIEVAVVSDAEPVLQALRDELRPELPELSGVLGTRALMPAVLDVDYSNDRVIARCADKSATDRCVVRPAVLSRDVLSETCAHCPQPDVLNCVRDE